MVVSTRLILQPRHCSASKMAAVTPEWVHSVVWKRIYVLTAEWLYWTHFNIISIKSTCISYGMREIYLLSNKRIPFNSYIFLQLMLTRILRLVDVIDASPPGKRISSWKYYQYMIMTAFLVMWHTCGYTGMSHQHHQYKEIAIFWDLIQYSEENLLEELRRLI